MIDYLLQQARAPYWDCLNVSQELHHAYARAHDLIYVVRKGPILPDWTGHWDAIPLMLEMMQPSQTRWIFWVDADALIVGNEDIRQALPEDAELGMCRHPGPPDHWNCGVLCIRNTPSTRAWLRAIIAEGPGVYPHYQQGIMNDLLEQRAWRGMCARLDDRWNSTVVLNGPEDCVIRAWHAGGAPAVRALKMKNEIARRGLTTVGTR